MQGREVDALVLRSVAYGEADRVITLFCRDLGCLAVIARGARKSQRRFGGGLDFGTLGRAALRLLPGRDLGHLERFDVVRRPAHFGDDLARMAHGAYAAELVGRLVAPHHAENDLFAWLSSFLAVLDDQGATAPRLRTFELGLLRALGLTPVLDRCAVCGRPFDPGATTRLRWSPEAGGVACGTCVDRGRPLGEAVRQTLLQLRDASLEGGQNVTPDANRACREALAEIFAQHLNGPLKTVEFIHKMEAAETRVPAIYPPPLSQ